MQLPVGMQLLSLAGRTPTTGLVAGGKGKSLPTGQSVTFCVSSARRSLALPSDCHSAAISRLLLLLCKPFVRDWTRVKDLLNKSRNRYMAAPTNMGSGPHVMAAFYLNYCKKPALVTLKGKTSQDKVVIQPFQPNPADWMA